MLWPLTSTPTSGLNSAAASPALCVRQRLRVRQRLCVLGKRDADPVATEPGGARARRRRSGDNQSAFVITIVVTAVTGVVVAVFARVRGLASHPRRHCGLPADGVLMISA